MTSRFFNDPLAGVGYTFGQKLPSSNESEVLASLRKVERSLTFKAARSVRFSFKLGFGSPLAAWSEQNGVWVFANGLSGTLNLAAVDASGQSIQTQTRSINGSCNSLSEAMCAGETDGGVIVIGLTPATATATKIQVSTDGLTWSNATLGGSNTDSVAAVKYDFKNSKFIALVNTGQCYTSTDGFTWTSRTVGAGLTGATWYSMAISGVGAVASPPGVGGGGFAVAFPNGGTGYMTSPDGGVTWTTRVFPATLSGYTVSWLDGLGIFAACNGTASAYVSADGLTWTLFTPPTTHFQRIIGIGAMAIALSENVDVPKIYFAYDSATLSTVNWRFAAALTPDGNVAHSTYQFNAFGGSDHQWYAVWVDDTAQVRVSLSEYV